MNGSALARWRRAEPARCEDAEPGGRRYFGLLLWIGAVTVHLAVFWIYFEGRVPPAGDTPVYFELAEGFFEGRGMTLGGRPSATYPPVYPILLAILAPDGEPTGVLVAFQMAISASVAVAAYWIARSLWGHRAGFASGLLAALTPQLPFWAAYVLSDSVGTALLVWSMAVAVAAVRRSSGISWDRGASSFGRWKLLAFVAGLLGGLAALCRPLNVPALIMGQTLVILWGVPVAGEVSWKPRRRDGVGGGAEDEQIRSRKRRLGAAILLTIGFAIPVVAWTGRNLAVMRAPIVFSTRTGWQLLQGVQWQSQGRGTVGVDVFYPAEASNMSEVEADRYLASRAFEEITGAPRKYVSKVATRIAWLFAPASPGQGRGMVIAGLFFELVLALAVLAVVYKGTRTAAIPFVAGGLGVVASVAVTILDPDYRYRLPLLVLLVVPAGAGADLAYRRFCSLAQRKRSRPSRATLGDFG